MNAETRKVTCEVHERSIQSIRRDVEKLLDAVLDMRPENAFERKAYEEAIAAALVLEASLSRAGRIAHTYVIQEDRQRVQLIERLEASLRARMEHRCPTCNAALANIVGPGDPGNRFEAVLCPTCDHDAYESALEVSQ